MAENKYGKLLFQIFSLLCFVAIGVCFICDFAINKMMVWSGYPIISILFAFAAMSPLFLTKRNKILFSLVIMTITTIPFLYLLERLTPIKHWFLNLGVPIAIISIVAVWILFFIIKFLKINKWYLWAIAIFLFGVVVSTTVKYFVSSFLKTNFYSLDNFISFLSCIAATILLVIIGHSKQQNKS